VSIPRILLGLVLASAALLFAASAVPEAPGATASAHPGLPTLLGGGDGARDPRILAVGWAFGAVQIAFFAACFALGLARGGRLGPLARPLLAGLGVYEVLWAGLVASYAWTAGDPHARLWASFPLPTAWMLYALWPFPLWFAALYLRHFDTWFLNEADLERFRARVAELSAEAERRDGPDG
jgi:hypothetical protein